MNNLISEWLLLSPLWGIWPQILPHAADIWIWPCRWVHLNLALQLCPPLQFGPLTYQPIECVFISSNQSALWSCLYHLTSQLGEGCSMSFVRFVLLIRWKTCVWNSFGAFSPMGFWRIYRSAKYVRNFPRSTHMFICWRARKHGTGMKAPASCPNKEFEQGQ